MQIYLSKMKIMALLMMLEDAEGAITGNGDGWAGLNKINREFYDNIIDVVYDLKEQLEEKGYTYEKLVRPIIGY